LGQAVAEAVALAIGSTVAGDFVGVEGRVIGAVVTVVVGVGISGVIEAAAVPVSTAAAVWARPVARWLVVGPLLPEPPQASAVANANSIKL
jgi:hypothetical protein